MNFSVKSSQIQISTKFTQSQLSQLSFTGSTKNSVLKKRRSAAKVSDWKKSTRTSLTSSPFGIPKPKSSKITCAWHQEINARTSASRRWTTAKLTRCVRVLWVWCCWRIAKTAVHYLHAVPIISLALLRSTPTDCQPITTATASRHRGGAMVKMIVPIKATSSIAQRAALISSGELKLGFSISGNIFKTEKWKIEKKKIFHFPEFRNFFSIFHNSGK